MAGHPFPEALARCGGDETALAATATIVSEDAPEQFAKVINNLESGQSEPAAFAAHTLKGMLSTFGGGDAIAGLQAVEDSAKGGDVERALQCLTNCKVKIESLISDIHQIANRAT